MKYRIKADVAVELQGLEAILEGDSEKECKDKAIGILCDQVGQLLRNTGMDYQFPEDAVLIYFAEEA